MLLNVGNKQQSTKLPKLTVDKKPTVKRTQTKTAVNDYAEVAAKMKELFSDVNWKVVTTEEELLDYIAERDELGLDTETTGLDVFKDKLVGMSLGTDKDCIYVPFAHEVGQNYSGSFKRIEEMLMGKDLYGFNAKFDMKMLRHHAEIKLRMKWCGFLAARLMYSLEESNELKALYVKHVDPNATFYEFRQLFRNKFSSYDPAIVGAYAAVDAMKHYKLAKWQMENIGKPERKLLQQLELPLAHQLVDIELTGVKLDTDWCTELTDLLQKDKDAIAAEIEANYPGLNAGSPKQVAEWLYDKLGMPETNGRGTNEATLAAMNNPLADKILEYRKAQKMLSTYAEKMPKIADDGVIHCTFNQYGADTGRFSSSNPNLQNIPRDNRFRRMFVARPGHMLVSCDYTQQEVYILAALANDQSMQDAYNKGMDFYAYMASIVFEVPYEQCLKHAEHGELRGQMKSIVLGLNYDMGVAHLAKEIGKTVKETKDIYAKFFEKCPRVKQFRNEQLKFAVENGYVETVLGRKRYFATIQKPDFESEDQAVADMLNKLRNDYAIRKLLTDAAKEGIKVQDNRGQKAYETRQVVNSIIQGSAADMTKLAMVQAGKDEELNRLGCKILLQIHDEIIAEFPEENAEEGGRRLADLMVDVGSDLIGLRMQCDPSCMKVWEKD